MFTRVVFSENLFDSSRIVDTVMFENPSCVRIYQALKLANYFVMQVARLLMDTTVLQFYPTIFVLATDIMDTLGNMVWERIKWKAEFAEDGTRLCLLPGLFHLDLSLLLSCISIYLHLLILCGMNRKIR